MNEINIKRLTDYFKSGIKAPGVMDLGIELEHIIVDNANCRAVDYYEKYGIETVIKDLNEYWKGTPKQVEGHLVGFSTSDFTISIEPAGQLEISIASQKNLGTIKTIYDRFIDSIEPIMDHYGYGLKTVGYQPVSKVSQLALVPGKRYEYMDRYFKDSGTRGRYMMRGTAALQISIDYNSKEDFVAKYQAAAIIMPAIMLLSDNARVFEGQPYDRHALRSWIWKDVDKRRCGLPNDLFSGFSFKSYASYIYKIPLIYRDERYIGNQTLSEIYGEDGIIDRKMIIHALSMVFPDIRVKNYLEIRYLDSVPFEYALGFAALFKGIFQSRNNIKMLLCDYDASIDKIRTSIDNIEEFGYDAMLYGKTARAFMQELLLMAANSLRDHERKYLLPITLLVEKEQSVRDVYDIKDEQ